MYRPTKREPRGRWARHLQEQRRLRDLSVVQAFELIQERIGWSPKSRTAYGAIDIGDRQPKPSEAAILAEEFGWPPDPEITDDLEDATLATALLAFSEELRAVRVERVTLAARMERVEAVLEGLVQRAMPDAIERSAPRGTTG
jgi:hypothetical protein